MLGPPGSLSLWLVIDQFFICKRIEWAGFASSLVQFTSFNDAKISKKVNYSRKSSWFTNHVKVNAYFTGHEKIENHSFPRREKYRFPNHGRNKFSFTLHAKQKCAFTCHEKSMGDPQLNIFTERRHELGNSRKNPYPTTDGFHVLTPLAFGNSKMHYPPCPQNSIIVNPPPVQNFWFFFFGSTFST